MRATSQFLSKPAKYGQLQLKHWPCNTKLVKLYDTPETRILGQERSIYLWMEKNYPDTFRIVILSLINLGAACCAQNGAKLDFWLFPSVIIRSPAFLLFVENHE